MGKRGDSVMLVALALSVFLLVVSIALFSSVVSAGQIYECGSISTCNSQIAAASPGDTVRLNQSITGISTTAINITNVNNITFDCQGNLINGTKAASTYGILLQNSNNVNLTNCQIGGFYDGIYLISSSNNTLRNVTSSSNTMFGILLNVSLQNGLDNITSNNNGIGISLYPNSSNNQISNVIVNSNGYGIEFFYNSSNNVITNVTAFSNNFHGIYFYQASSNNKVYNAISNYNQNGIYSIIDSANNYFYNVTTNYNTQNGIQFQVSPNNTVVNAISNFNFNSGGCGLITYSDNTSVTNLTANSNFNGVNILSSSNNIVNESSFSNNSMYGVIVQSAGNYIYDNFFNNSFNFYNNSAVTIYLNTTQTLGTNIVGGPYIGGNYWANLTGTGYSETCPDDDANGICDLSYSFNGTIDYLPLTIPPLPLPNISLAPSSDIAGTYLRNYIQINVTAVDNGGGLHNITVNLYNSTSLVQSTVSQTSPFFVNFTGLSDGAYYINASAVNDYGFANSTNIGGEINLDTQAPSLNISSPLSQYYASSNILLNYTVSDAGTSVSSTWYGLKYSNGTNLISNTTLSGNTSFSVPGEGNYILVVYSNDSVGHLVSSSVGFAVTLSGPVISIASPSNNSWFGAGEGIEFNFTANDAVSIPNCSIYTNSMGTWKLNKTLTSITLGSPVTTTIDFGNNSVYKWNVLCADSSGFNTFALNNLTFGTDNVNPLTENLSVTTTDGSNSISFVSNESDNMNLSRCFYTIYSGGSVDGSNNNKTFACNSQVSAVVSNYGTYTLVIYANDSAGNLNSTNASFTTVAPATTTTITSGGGGGTTSGGGTTGTTSDNSAPSETFTGTISSVTAGVPAILNVNSSSGIDFTSLKITTNKDASNVGITLTSTSVSSSDLQVAGPGLTYQSFEINTSGINDTDIDNVSIDFKVNKSWLTDNDLNTSSIVLYRNPGTGWGPLPTNLTSEDTQYYYFSALSPGFSTYTIFASTPLAGNAVNEQTSSGSISEIWNTIRDFFTNATPSFFRQMQRGYVFYYALVVLVLGGIVFVSYNLFNRFRSKNAQKAWKEANKRKKKK